MQNLVLQAVNRNNRVCYVNWNPIQCRNFLKRFKPELVWLKNVLVVTKVEKLFFQPLTNFFIRLTSLSKIRVALFKINLEDLCDVWLKISQQIQWLFHALQALKSSPYYISLTGFCIVECLISLLCNFVKTKISQYAWPCFDFDQNVLLGVPAFIISIDCAIIC